MKIKPEHYAHILAAIEGTGANTAEMRAAIIAEGRAKDVEKRLRWDLAWRSGLTPWLRANVYLYADDTHLDTVLRAVVKHLEGQQS
jgi:hypothetical protein